MTTLSRRSDFLAANRGLRAPMPGFVLLVRPREDGGSAMRLGITVTKKIGNAVIRNRMKRRFRALARDVLPEQGFAGADHVLIGRAGGIERDFSALRSELLKALKKIKTANPEPVEGRNQLERGRPAAACGSTGSALAGVRVDTEIGAKRA
ncbi:ribonuclease P protein component [Allosphingosinicella vermicomposti]|uniref:ribonuclease P protein component n=1 Tax=Allosphingosinicella vermicomposti TaxID=614671 RepID=UPI000D103193|nr:ribonuclease P protein component [Allosphingosinicella vermicomposti]